MTNRGAVSQTLNCGGEYTIPSGYHNGSGKVTTNSLSSQTSADAVAANILKDKTAWVNGSKVTGTMVNNGAVAPAALGAGGSYTIPAGYHNGSGKVTVSSLATITSGGTITNANQILSGYKAYSDGTLYTGSMTNQGAQTKTFSPSGSSQSYTIPAGYHNGSGKVTCNAVSNLTAANIKKGVTVGGVTGTFEGWVGTATDLYLRGTNSANLKFTNTTWGSGTFDSGAIYINKHSRAFLYSSKSYNFSGYTKLNFEVMKETLSGTSVKYISCALYEGDPETVGMYEHTKYGTINVSSSNTIVTGYIDISTINKSFYPGIGLFGKTSSTDPSGTNYPFKLQIYRIWLS